MTERRSRTGKKCKRPDLTLIRGTAHSIRLGCIEITAARADRPPFAVDAMAFEEDTFLVLSADPLLEELDGPSEHPIRLMTQLMETRPEAPGSLIIRTRCHPLRFLAVIHDLDQAPSWREEWIVSALKAIFEAAEGRRLGSLAVPFLGVQHGALKKERFLLLLRGVLERMRFVHLRRLWLMTPTAIDSRMLNILLSDPVEGES